jgi:4-cresol dehydrogenase (hydroxylating)
MALPIPKGVSAQDFNAALDQFRQIVGDEWVFASEADVTLYRDAYSPLWDEPDELVPSAAVAPASVEQVQGIVRTASQYRIPLFAISTGKNLGYGGSAPNLTGSVIVDLKRMNKVIEVDDRRNFCIVEPGVSYFDLYKYIQERVTKMGFWMMSLPEHFLACMVKVPRYRDIIPLIDVVNYLEDQGLVGHPRYSCPMDPMVLMMEPEVYKVTDELKALHAHGGTVEEYEAYARKHNLEYWNVILNIYGPKKAVYANWEHAQEKLSGISGVQFQELESYALPVDEATKKKVRHKVAIGIPEMAIFAIGARSEVVRDPSDGHLWFSPIIPRSGEALIEAHQVFAQAAKDLGGSPLGPTITPQTWQYRTYVPIFPFPISRSDRAHNRRIREFFPKLVEVAAKHGWTEYRTAPVFQDIVAKTYSFNNNILLRFQTQLKDAIDPDGIIAPGRGGIWPKRYAEKRQ